MAETPALSASGLALRAPDGRVILDGASLELPAGGRAWIEGAAGSGKRALLKVLAGLLKPDAGGVELGDARLWPGDGVAHLKGRVRVGFAFAQGGLLSNHTLRGNLALPLRFAGQGAADLDRKVGETLARFGLEAQGDLRPHALGARARRLAQLARIELLRPQAVFLCEPLADLEGADLAFVSDLIRTWASEPRLLLATAEHAPPGLMAGARRCRLEAGRILSAILSDGEAP